MFSDTVSDPTDTVVEAGVAELRTRKLRLPDRLRRRLADRYREGDGDPRRRRRQDARLQGAGRRRQGALPIIAIPTTAGTGSECTRFTVITDTERDEKMLIAGLGALPLAAIVDYELTYTVPPRTTADTGVDSLTHALEAYVPGAPTRSPTRSALSAMG